MKLITALRTLVGVVALNIALLAQPAASAAAGAWKSADFRAVVSGTSTLHDWSVETRTAAGEFRSAGDGRSQGRIRIPATSLSGGPAGLNEKMYAALKTSVHPEITFVLSERRIGATEAAPSNEPQIWNVRGQLTIAGISREVNLACRATPVDGGGFALETDTALKMTDFGIKPPGFMGVVRTGDVVKISLRWELRPQRDMVAAN